MAMGDEEYVVHHLSMPALSSAMLTLWLCMHRVRVDICHLANVTYVRSVAAESSSSFAQEPIETRGVLGCVRFPGRTQSPFANRFSL